MPLSNTKEASFTDQALEQEDTNKISFSNSDGLTAGSSVFSSYSLGNNQPINEAEMDEDDITIMQLTNELNQLQQLLVQYQSDQQKKHEHNLAIASSLTSLVNDFFNRYDTLKKNLEAQLAKFDQDYELLSDDLTKLTKVKIHELRRKIKNFEIDFQTNSLDEIASIGDEIILSFEHISEEVTNLLTDLIKKIDPSATGLIPNNIVIKLQVTKSLAKLKRIFASYLSQWNEKCDYLETLILPPPPPKPLPLKPFVFPKHGPKLSDSLVAERQPEEFDNKAKLDDDKVAPIIKSVKAEKAEGFELPVTYKLPDLESFATPTKAELATDFKNSNSADIKETNEEENNEILIPSPDFISDNNGTELDDKNNFELINQRIDYLTNEIEMLKEKLQKESQDLEQIVSNRDSKWEEFFNSERLRYEKLLSDIRNEYEDLLSEKRNKLVDEITNKIELKTSEILEKENPTVTEANLNEIYSNIANQEKANFTNIISQEQKNFQAMLEDERKRFEAIIALKAKEFAQEKAALVAEKNVSLEHLEHKMQELKKERDNLLEEKNSLIIDLQNIANKTINHSVTKPQVAVNNTSTNSDNVVDEDYSFNHYEFNKLNELRAKKIEEEIEKAEAAQIKAQKIYSDFEKQRFSLQQQLKLVNEHNSIENLTQEITKKIASKFDEELQKIKSERNVVPNVYNINQPPYQGAENFNQDFLPKINEQPNPSSTFQPIAPIYHPQQPQMPAEINQPPVYFQPFDQINPIGFNQIQNHMPKEFVPPGFNANEQAKNHEEDQSQRTQEQTADEAVVSKPTLRKAKFLKSSTIHGRLTSEEIRKYANAIISANRRKHAGTATS